MGLHPGHILPPPSLAPRGASGLKFTHKHTSYMLSYCLAPRGASGLKSEPALHLCICRRLAPRGASGLKFIVASTTNILVHRLAPRGASGLK